MNLHFGESGGVVKHDAYSRLLFDVLRNDQTLFVSESEVEAAWEWVDQIFASWKEADMPVEGYPAGGFGPVGADELTARTGRHWHEVSDN